MARCLVTGHRGFIGSHFVEEALHKYSISCQKLRKLGWKSTQSKKELVLGWVR